MMITVTPRVIFLKRIKGGSTRILRVTRLLFYCMLLLLCLSDICFESENADSNETWNSCKYFKYGGCPEMAQKVIEGDVDT